MTSTAPITEEMRERIIAQPEVILDDHEMMRALIAANERSMGANIVDLRGIAMERLESRLDRLEETHRSVIAAAYENLAGMNLIHRAVLRMLDPGDFESFMTDLGGEVAEVLQVDCIRLVLETELDEGKAIAERLGEMLVVGEPGFVSAYIGEPRAISPRPVVLRQVHEQDTKVYGESGVWIRSEACLRLDLGEGRLPGMLVLGAEDPHQFKPGQGTDLLGFFAGVFERAMRHWLG
ncbi:MAG: recombinase XerC [Rhodobacterales bacterium]|nr:MAG: recombinase XerC [Rhodobacterales bacterium]